MCHYSLIAICVNGQKTNDLCSIICVTSAMRVYVPEKNNLPGAYELH